MSVQNDTTVINLIRNVMFVFLIQNGFPIPILFIS